MSNIPRQWEAHKNQMGNFYEILTPFGDEICRIQSDGFDDKAIAELIASAPKMEDKISKLIKALNTVDECVQALSILSNIDVGDVRKHIKNALEA